MKVNAGFIAAMFFTSEISGAVEGTSVILFPDGDGSGDTILFPDGSGEDKVIAFPKADSLE